LRRGAGAAISVQYVRSRFLARWRLANSCASIACEWGMNLMRMTTINFVSIHLLHYHHQKGLEVCRIEAILFAD